MTRDLIQLLMASREEINGLRRTMNQMAPKAEAYDALIAVIHQLPKPRQGMAVDVIPALTEKIAELIDADKTESENNT